MKRPELLLGAIVATFAAFVAVQATRTSRSRPASATRTTDSVGTIQLVTQEGDLIRVRQSTLPPPAPKNFAAIALAITEARSPVSYMDEILVARGQNVARWVDRRDEPITVWIDKKPGVKDFWPEYPDLARNAFYTWSNAGIPLRFLFVADSTNAEVKVRWVDRFNDSAAGKTYWARDVNWWIVGADIELALHSPAGEAYDREAVHAIALHEVGHLIGLDHTANQENIMAPRVRAMRLSTADLNTAHLIYKLPPGSVRDSARP